MPGGCRSTIRLRCRAAPAARPSSATSCATRTGRCWTAVRCAAPAPARQSGVGAGAHGTDAGACGRGTGAPGHTGAEPAGTGTRLGRHRDRYHRGRGDPGPGIATRGDREPARRRGHGGGAGRPPDDRDRAGRRLGRTRGAPRKPALVRRRGQRDRPGSAARPPATGRGTRHGTRRGARLRRPHDRVQGLATGVSRRYHVEAHLYRPMFDPSRAEPPVQMVCSVCATGLTGSDGGHALSHPKEVPCEFAIRSDAWVGSG